MARVADVPVEDRSSGSDPFAAREVGGTVDVAPFGLNVVETEMVEVGAERILSMIAFGRRVTIKVSPTRTRRSCAEVSPTTPRPLAIASAATGPMKKLATCGSMLRVDSGYE